MGNNIQKWVVFGDLHFPNQSVESMKALYAFMKYYNPYGIVNIGDTIDLDSISKFNDEKPLLKEGLRLKRDIELFNESLNYFNKIKSIKKKIFIMGNHEYRINKYYQKHSELVGMVEFKDEAINCDYDFIPYNGHYMIGDVATMHGNFTNIMASKKHLDVYGCSVIFGHTHRMSVYSKNTLEKNITAYNIGTMSKLNLHYMEGRLNDWVNGFAIVERNIDTNKCTVLPIRIIDGEFMYNGKIFSGNK